MTLYRALELLAIGTIAWSLLFIGGKVPGPDSERISAVGTAVQAGIIGAAQIAGEAVRAFKENTP